MPGLARKICGCAVKLLHMRSLVTRSDLHPARAFDAASQQGNAVVALQELPWISGTPTRAPGAPVGGRCRREAWCGGQAMSGARGQARGLGGRLAGEDLLPVVAGGQRCVRMYEAGEAYRCTEGSSSLPEGVA